MAVKKRLYKSRLEQAIEELDNSVYVVEVDGKKVNDQRNNNYPLNHIRNVLDEGVKDVRVRSTSSNTSKKKKKDTWLSKGAFEDGYDFGDITKTILGTTGDIGLGVLHGAGSLVEGVADLATYGVSGLAKSFGQDEFAEKAKSFAIKDFVGDAMQDAEDAMDKYSVIGEKGDRISQGLGQVAGIILTGGAGAAGGLGTAATTALTTGVTFTSSMGSGIGEAYQGGATDEEAVKYGAIAGAGDAITELLFGGLGKGINAVGLSKGLSSADDMLAKTVSSKFNNQIAKNLVQFGIKSGAEGTEEVLAGVVSAAGKKLTYMSEEDIGKLLEDEQLFEQFVMGAVTSGVAQSGFVPGMQQGSLAEANAKGRDFVTGFTQNEQSVIDKEVQNRIGDKKLTNKEISKIKEEVETDFKKGYISTDTIESVLGGKEYESYKSVLDKQAELDKINNTKKSEIETLGDEDALRARKKALEEELSKTDINTLRDDLNVAMGDRIKSDDFLKQSYLEQAKKGQSFTYDKAKVKNDFEKVALESASRVMNDTNRSHEFVEPIVKMAKDKGTYYEFTNNEELSKTKYNVKGKTINGLTVVETDGKTKVLINVDSNKALNAVLGHETTHLLEGTEEYKELQKTIFEFAKQKGDYDARVEKLNSLYENIEGADINSELTADLVGDYLFEDTDFVNSLSTQKPTVFQRIKELIDDLVVRFKGTKEEKALRDLQKKFKEAYRQTGTQTDTKYSLESDSRDYAKEIAKSFKGQNEVSLNEIMEKANEYAFGELDTDYNYTQQDNTVDEEFSDNIIEKVKFELDKMGYHLDEDTDMFTKQDINQYTKENIPLENRVSGDELLDAQDLIDEIKSVGGEVDENGYVTVYHQTSNENAQKIIETGVMASRELDVFFSTSKDAQQSEGRGTTKLEFKIPAEKLILDDIFSDNADVKIPLNGKKNIDVSEYLVNTDNPDIRYSLSEAQDGINREAKTLYHGTSHSAAMRIQKYGIIPNSAIGSQEKTGRNANNFFSSTYDNAKTYALRKDGYTSQMLRLKQTDDITIDDLVEAYDGGNNDYITSRTINPDEIQIQVSDGVWTPIKNYDLYFDTPQNEKVIDKSLLYDDDYNLINSEEYSLSNQNDIAPRNPNLTYGEDVKLQVEEAIAPLQEEIQQLKESLQTTTNNLQTVEDYKPITEEDLPMFEKQLSEAPLINEAPIEVEEDNYYQRDTISMDKKSLAALSKNIRTELGLNKAQTTELESVIQEFSRSETATKEDLFNAIRDRFNEKNIKYKNDEIATMKSFIRDYPIYVSDYLKTEFKEGFNKVRQSNFNKVKFTNNGTPVDVAYQELSSMYPAYFPSDIDNAQDQLQQIIDVANYNTTQVEKMIIPDEIMQDVTDFVYDSVQDYKLDESIKASEQFNKELGNLYVKGKLSIPDFSDSEMPIKKLTAPEPRTRATSNEPIKKGYQLTIDGNAEKIIDNSTYNQVAEVLTTEPKTESDRNKRKWAIFKANIFDKGIVFEDLSLKTKNRELIAKWDYTLTSNARGQHVIGNGHNGQSKSLDAIRQQVDNTGLTKEFYEYMYHKHNVDRMTLDKRFQVENKPVFGESVTAEMSQAIVNKYESQHPEFMDFAQDVYDYVNADKQQLVDSGVISQEIADLWGKMYPHYVPTRRTTDTGIDINVPLDTGKTGINAPIKKATGGSADILPLFDTMAMRTLQTYRATAKNNFGVELKNTLGTTLETNQTSVDEVIDNIDSQDGLLQEGVKGKNPTFTVFENGEKITFEITKDMYDALKPVSESSMLSKTSKTLNTIGNVRRGLLTEYNPTFMFTNAIKDVQDVLINSQHAAKTYSKIPEALKQLTSKGYWYQEYVANGGEQNSYFDNETNTFKTENKGLEKVMNSFPLSTISKINNFIEMTPRLAEYIASREAGRSIEVSMLDAARVTTNFKAGGDVTKWANRNGATFLNASVQGAMQQVRNIREANANGFRGYVNLATKFAIASLPAVLLNNLVWEDDEEYEELSDYVKQNYYVVAKDDDGTFIRIPKGRTVAVIQEAFNQMENLVTGDDEADLKTFIDLAINNLAPNNPLDNNILSPIVQVANNEAWYGGDLVPTRLQDLPASEQYDESTDKFSRWIGKTFNVSPYKVNYLLDQYSGGLGDVLLPMITPEATNDAETFGEYLTAPFKSKFTTNSTMNNQNISDFYDTSEELITNAKKSNATDKDVLSNKYINSVKAEMNELYKEKREIQNSDLSKSEKYEQVLDIQSQINELAENALYEYNSVKTSSNYSTVGDREYYKKINEEGEVEWNKVDNDLADDLDSLGLTRAEKNTYFKAKDEISYIDKDSETKKSEIIDIIQGTGLEDNTKAYLYKKYYNTDTIDTIVKSGISVDAYFDYAKEEFVADKDSSGKTISGSRKKKVISYVNSLDLSIPEKAILIKSTNTFKFNEYNKQIVEYVGGLDISYDEKVSLLEELDMKVYADGTVKWE